jgi:hypothetical protein
VHCVDFFSAVSFIPIPCRMQFTGIDGSAFCDPVIGTSCPDGKVPRLLISSQGFGVGPLPEASGLFFCAPFRDAEIQLVAEVFIHVIKW